MSFTQKIGELTQSINELDALQESAKQAESFERRANQLNSLARGYRAMDPFVSVLQSLDPPIAISQHPSIGPLVALLSDLQRRYSENVNAIITPFEDPEIHYKAHFLDPLTALCQALSEDLQNAWSSWSSSQLALPDGMENILVALGGISQMRQKVNAISERLGSAQEICDQLPASQDVVDRIHTLSKEINELWDSLVGEGVPDSVLDFLLLAGADRGVSYADLTAEVLGWLTDHDLLPSVRIKIG